MKYQAIPVEEAKAIADKYGKDQVLIFAFDRESGLMHTTTFGRSEADKLQAAVGGDAVASILTDVSKKVIYEDFRLAHPPNASEN